ncbi:MAG: LysE family translocator [Phyllobacteriaceae bacterium]|nr:LysE family translocator [Phyllobacteriaceae bacterium]
MIAALWLYFILLVGIIVVPGMDMMFVLANALAGGRAAGLAATAGIVLGGMVHTVTGTVFVVALANLVPAIGQTMIVAGSLYMMWIGLTLARSRIEVRAVDAKTGGLPLQTLVQGFIVCLLNPKAWMFILSVYPQFMRTENGPIWIQAVIMGIMTSVVQVTVYGGLALAALRGRDALVHNPQTTVWIGRGAGLLLIALAAYALYRSVGPD